MKGQQNKHRRYNASVKGIARNFRYNHGYNLEDSLWFARKCVNDYSQCSICGLPQYFNKQQKIYFTSDHRSNRRLCLDHISPTNNSTRINTRILCMACNSIRGAAIKSDKEVLTMIRKWYRKNFNLRLLFWLNKNPGEGGNLFRTKHMERKAMRLLGQEGIEELLSLNIKIDNKALFLPCS